MITLETVLAVLPKLVPLIPQAQALGEFIHEVVETFDEQDQDVLVASIAELTADNDVGHPRLQAKLAAAALRK